MDPDSGARAAAEGLKLAALSPADGEDGGPADVVVLAVKPDQLAAALARFRPPAEAGAVFLSIVAGKPLALFARLLGPAAVVRAMPNTPAAIGRAMTVLCSNHAVTEAQRALCQSLLSAVGETAWLADERHMDAVTAVSGSGPAYVFLLIECLTEAGVDVGLDRDLARQLAEVTVAGAGAYANASDEPAAELRRRVTSPGGTTQAALAVLMGDDGLTELIKRAVRAATVRSRELSGD
jgi:pyrroline-5-carboxylate reductase